MEKIAVHEDLWPYVVTLLPADLEESARASEALIRCRNVPNAAALMRMALAYAVSDLSLKDVAAWAHAQEVAQITGPGLFYRLREAEAWLQQVLATTLQWEITLPTRQGPTAKSWLLSRFLAAALAQRLAQPVGPLPPFGYDLQEAGIHQ